MTRELRSPGSPGTSFCFLKMTIRRRSLSLSVSPSFRWRSFWPSTPVAVCTKTCFWSRRRQRHFVRSLLRPVDHLDLMEFSDNVREMVFFTNNPGRIDRGLNDMARGAATALYSGVYLASQSLAPRSGRKVLVIISDGGNTVKGTTYDQALEQALRGEVMVYPIIDVPIYASAGRDLAGEHALITLAQETGGKYYYADASSLDKTFAQFSEDLRTQYLLGLLSIEPVGKRLSQHLRQAA